jgi:translation initiation factor 2 subunit 2
LETDLGIKKKKKKKVAKDGEGDDFAAKLAALDLDKEGGEAADEETAQDGDM